MAPIHHHFEMKAWSETKIMVRFWIVTAILCGGRLRALLQVLPEHSPRRIEGARLRPRAVGRARPPSGSPSAATRSCSSTARSATRTTSRCSTASSCSSSRRASRRTRRSSAAARERGVPVWSEVELGCRLLPGSAVRRRHRHERQDDDHRAARRDLPRRRARRRRRRERRHAADVGARRPTGSSASCRASSSRTCTTFACDVAVLLNLEPDHLDRHGSFEAYRDAKLRIFERARVEVVPRGSGPRRDRVLGRRPAARRAAAPRRAQPRERRGRDRGRPRRRDRATRRSPRRCAPSPASPHRLELVGEVDGVRFVNDSKATNVAAARTALEAYASTSRCT